MRPLLSLHRLSRRMTEINISPLNYDHNPGHRKRNTGREPGGMVQCRRGRSMMSSL
jgi:hypothetical protein